MLAAKARGGGPRSGPFAVCLRRRRVELSARLKEKAKQYASADNVGKRAKGKEGNQDQQHDDRRRDRLMKRATANFGQGIGKRAMTQITDNQLLQHGQHDEQSEKDK